MEPSTEHGTPEHGTPEHEKPEHEKPEHGKETSGFIAHGTSLEPDSMALGIDLTPLERFYVCSAGPAPSIAASDWQLHLDGDGLAAPQVFTLDDLIGLPQRRVTSWLECAGNGRRMYDLAGGHSRSEGATDTPWKLGAMGIATWQGPRLRDVLALAGVLDDAAWIGPTGLDTDNDEGEPVRMSLPLTKGQEDDTIVALRMNDQPLTAAHGFPARLLVPGWVGAYSVKWLGRLEVSTRWVPSWRADEYYVHRLPNGTKLGPATVHPVKSCLALPWPSTLTPGPQTITGYARVGESTIDSVEVRIDGGRWQPAELFGPNDALTWAPFRFAWNATAGPHTIATRAHDASGQCQPDTQPFHPNTILWNAVTEHPVRVEDSQGVEVSE